MLAYLLNHPFMQSRTVECRNSFNNICNKIYRLLDAYTWKLSTHAVRVERRALTYVGHVTGQLGFNQST